MFSGVFIGLVIFFIIRFLFQGFVLLLGYCIYRGRVRCIVGLGSFYFIFIFVGVIGFFFRLFFKFVFGLGCSSKWIK